MKPHPLQLKYWAYLEQICAHAHYLQLYQEHSERVDRNISIALAITSSASIAGWAVWQNLSGVWPTLIALSQVIGVVKAYLPYAKRLEVLKEYSGQFKHLALRTEREYYKGMVCNPYHLGDRQFNWRTPRGAMGT